MFGIQSCAGIMDTKGRLASEVLYILLLSTIPILNQWHISTQNSIQMLTFGRDVLRLHKVYKLINDPHDLPFAQKPDLVCVIVGNVCLGNSISQFHLAHFTPRLDNGQPSLLVPCPNVLQVKDSGPHIPCCSRKLIKQTIWVTVFECTKDDEKVALSIKDDNSWVAPLPFKNPWQCLPYNREQLMKRFSSLLCNFKMRGHFVSCMVKIFQNRYGSTSWRRRGTVVSRHLWCISS